MPADKSRVAILSPCLRDFDSAYSISHVILDQARMLQRNGHYVAVFVSEAFEGEKPVDIELWCNLPDPSGSKDISADTTYTCQEYLDQFHTIVTYDWISHPRMREHFEGMKQYVLQSDPDARTRAWLHWVLSIPSYRHEWWNLKYFPGNHWLVYPNMTDLDDAMSQFRAARGMSIPHIVDLRTIIEWSPDARRLLDAMPGLITSEFVQIYPAAADRLLDKGIDKLVNVFGALKNEGDGHEVCCLVLDSWTGRLPRQDKRLFKQLARIAGLTEDEFRFASDIIPDFRGFSRQEVFLFQILSNVFVMPSRGEAFGLVLAEAMLAGAYPVPNGSCSPLKEVALGHGYYPEFGSVETASRFKSQSFEECAREIVQRVHSDLAIQRVMSIRRAYCFETIYREYWEPILCRGQNLP